LVFVGVTERLQYRWADCTFVSNADEGSSGTATASQQHGTSCRQREGGAAAGRQGGSGGWYQAPLGSWAASSVARDSIGGDVMAEQRKAAEAAPSPVSSTAPAVGNGKEVLLQVGRRV
jgi:hypothetical protein